MKAKKKEIIFKKAPDNWGEIDIIVYDYMDKKGRWCTGIINDRKNKKKRR